MMEKRRVIQTIVFSRGGVTQLKRKKMRSEFIEYVGQYMTESAKLGLGNCCISYSRLY